MPTGRSCVFCGKQPVTREHIFGDWIGRRLSRLLGDEPFNARLDDEESGQHEKRTTRKIDLTVRHFCKPCNTGWMSDIETAASPIMEPMMLGQSRAIALSPDDQLTLGRWAYKTALVNDLHVGGRQIPLANYRDFYQQRVIPNPGCVIWLAAYGGSKRAVQGHRRPMDIFVQHNHPMPSSYATGQPETKSVVTTLTVYRALFQVLTYTGGSWVPRRDGGLRSREVVARIWPSSDQELNWPPNGIALSDAAIGDFENRKDFL